MNRIFEFGGCSYRIEPLPLLDRLRVTSRLAPVFSSVAESIAGGVPAAGADDEQLIAFGSLIAVKAISQLSESDARDIIDTCLRACQRQRGGEWESIALGTLATDPMDDLLTALALAMRVIHESTGLFFATEPSVFTPPMVPFVGQA